MDGDTTGTVRVVPTARLAGAEIEAVRRLLEAAFGPDEDDRFTDDDWDHACGGVHFLLEVGASVIGHAAVVQRELHIDGLPVRTGYVEAVAVVPESQRKGHGTRLMRAVGAHIRKRFELGALGTGSHGFYERLGWRTWRGPSFVRTPQGMIRTADEDGFILVLPTSSSPPLDLDAPISCDWRRGDVW